METLLTKSEAQPKIMSCEHLMKKTAKMLITFVSGCLCCNKGRAAMCELCGAEYVAEIRATKTYPSKPKGSWLLVTENQLEAVIGHTDWYIEWNKIATQAN